MTFFAASGGLIFLAFVLILLVGLMLTLYTRRGSGIDAHPTGAGDAPGAAGPSDVDGDQHESPPSDFGTR
jgi:hypothetical protein